MKLRRKAFLPLVLFTLFSYAPFSQPLQPVNDVIIQPRPALHDGEIIVTYTLLNDDQVIPATVIGAPTYIDEPTPVQRDNVEIDGWFLEETLENEFVFETTLVSASMELFAQWEHIGSNDNAKLTQSVAGTEFMVGEVTLSLDLYLTDTVTYQWEFKRDEDDRWGTIVGATENTYTPRSNGNHGYRCVYRYIVDNNGIPDEKRRESEGVWLSLTGGFDWTPIYLSASAVILIGLALFLTWPTPIHYETNGGTPIPTAKTKAFADITLQPIPVREGYVFDGWFLDKELTKPFNLVRASRKKLRLYARWKKI